MDKRTRELVDRVWHTVGNKGGAIVEMTRDGREHFRFTIRRRNGTTFCTSFGATPSDSRSRLNEMARLRRKLNSPGISRERQGIANEIGR